MIEKLLSNLKKPKKLENDLPDDFIAEVYLELHPDVKAAGVDPAKHYLEFGIREGRDYKKASQEILDYYLNLYPNDEAAFKLFDGNWSSEIPGITDLGKSKLFDDERVKWWVKQAGGVNGKKILELGPLEGGHTYMLSEAGAKEIISIESNLISFLKCLVVQNQFKLNAKFLLGDFNQYLEKTDEKFDLIICSGVLYHMTEPLKLLKSMLRVSKKIAIWTHYYDEKTICNREDLVRKFEKTPQVEIINNRDILMYQQSYMEALGWDGFCGGSKPTSYWLDKESLLGFFKDIGMKIEIHEDNLNHPNGPAMTFLVTQ